MNSHFSDDVHIVEAVAVAKEGEHVGFLAAFDGHMDHRLFSEQELFIDLLSLMMSGSFC
jgi:hypothetical protein